MNKSCDEEKKIIISSQHAINIKPNTKFTLKHTRLLLKHARRDGISRNSLKMNSSEAFSNSKGSKDHTYSALYCYNLYNFDENSSSNSSIHQDDFMKFKLINIQQDQKIKIKDENSKICNLCREVFDVLITLPCSHEMCKDCFNGYIKGKLETRALIPNFINFNTSLKTFTIYSELEYMDKSLMIWCPFDNTLTLNKEEFKIEESKHKKLKKIKDDSLNKELEFEICISDQHISYDFLQKNVDLNILKLYQKQARFLVREATPFEVPCYVCGKSCIHTAFLTGCSKCSMTTDPSTKPDFIQSSSLKVVDSQDSKYCLNCCEVSKLENCLEEIKDIYINENNCSPQMCQNCCKILLISNSCDHLYCLDCNKSFCYKCGGEFTLDHYNPYSCNNKFCIKMRRPLIFPKDHKNITKFEFSWFSKFIIFMLSLIILPIACASLIPYSFACNCISDKTPYYNKKLNKRKSFSRYLLSTIIFVLVYICALLLIPITFPYTMICVLEFIS